MAKNGNIFELFSSSKYAIFKFRWQTKYCINQLETNTRSTAKYTACSQGPICQVWLSGLDANCGEPKGVEFGISYNANYKDSLIKMLLKFCQKAANSLTNVEKSVSLHTFQLKRTKCLQYRDYCTTKLLCVHQNIPLPGVCNFCSRK